MAQNFILQIRNEMDALDRIADNAMNKQKNAQQAGTMIQR